MMPQGSTMRHATLCLLIRGNPPIEVLLGRKRAGFGTGKWGGFGGKEEEGETIAGVGSMSDVDPLIGAQTKVYDLEGRTIIPGINETHIHVRDLGFQQYYAVNLEEARNIADVQRLLKERLDRLRQDGKLGGWSYPTTGEVGDWLFGLGWVQDRLEENEWPTDRSWTKSLAMFPFLWIESIKCPSIIISLL